MLPALLVCHGQCSPRPLHTPDGSLVVCWGIAACMPAVPGEPDLAEQATGSSAADSQRAISNTWVWILGCCRLML